MKSVTALYEDFDKAREVVTALVDAGFQRENISIVASDAAGTYSSRLQTDDPEDVSGGEGAGFGAVVGALVGVGAMLIPGIGPVIAAGPLVAGLVGAGVGAAAGAVTGGITASLIDLGVDEESANYYAEGIRRGGALVTVQADDTWADNAADIMNRYNPVNLDTKAAEWKTSGWQGFDENADAYVPTDTTHTSAATQHHTHAGGEEEKLQVVEEELQVGKREVERGGVRLHTYVTEEPVEEQVTLREEHVTVERNPVNRAATDADFATGENTIEMTERAEEAVVNKQARVVEEVVVRKDVEEHTETIRDTVRRKDVEVEGTGGNGNTYETYSPEFRTHYRNNFASAGQTYEYYDPAYRYGYNLASNPRYHDYDWQRLESEARTNWEAKNPNTWEDFKDAIRHGWEQVKEAVR